MTPPKLIMPCPSLNLKFYANVLDTLYHLSYFYILSLYVVSDLYEIQKICISPSLLYYLSPPFPLFTKFPLYSQNEWKEWNKKWSKFGILPYIHLYIYLTLMYIYLHFYIYLPLFDTNVKGFYRVIPCLAKNVLLTSRSVFKDASQFASAMSND